MNLQDTLSLRRPLIEPLEQRIAPALLVTGANLLGGAGNPTTGQASVGGNSLTLVKVLSGEAIVWYDHGNIEGISVGPNTSLDITGDVGWIVGNLTSTGHLSNAHNSGTQGPDGDQLLPNTITGITTHPLGPEAGSVGEIITGGSVQNLNISGNLNGVYAGNSAFNTGQNASSIVNGGVVSVAASSDVDFNPIIAGNQNSFSFTAQTTTALSGASITTAIIGNAQALQLFAGNGFDSTGHTAGLPGGSVSNITIENAKDGTTYDLQGGHGGNGTSGGAGGSIFNIKEVLSTGAASFYGGQGGTGTKGAGGAGGSIKSLNMQSDSTAYTIRGGAGGVGTPGGAGGSVTSVNFSNNTLSSGLVVAGNFTGGNAQDILLVDGKTGNMIIEQNNGSGTGFTPVVQDPYTDPVGYIIAGAGSNPVSALAVTVDNGTLSDIVVAYAGTSNLGVFLNKGGGVFTTPSGPTQAPTGTSSDGVSIPLPYAPAALAAGNFTGDANVDIAVLATASGASELLTLTGNGTGGFALPSTPSPGILIQDAQPVGLFTANIQNGSYADLIGGFKDGTLTSFLSTGATDGPAFSVVNTGVTVSGGIANLDFDPSDNLLLALNSTGGTVSVYFPQTGGTLAEVTSIAVSQQPGTALVAHFVPGSGSFAEDIQVLSKVGTGATLDTYSVTGSAYALATTTTSTEALRNFVPVNDGASTGVAAVGTSVEHFSFSANGGAFYDIGLPFSGKTVHITAGNGGDGATGQGPTGGNLPAKGGAGGEIYGMNIIAGVINIQAGEGGTGSDAAGGAGGLIGNSATINADGQSFSTTLEADSTLNIFAGYGGDGLGLVHTASGGAGGAVTGLNVSILTGTIEVSAGAGGYGGGGAGGLGGSVLSLKSASAGGDLSVAAGDGGYAIGSTGNGGAGGSVTGLTHTLILADQSQESAYNCDVTAGIGGNSFSAVGGAGGSISKVAMTLQPSNESVNNNIAVPSTTHTDLDTTLAITLTAGKGGNGATGGAGGSIKTVAATAIYDQEVQVSPTEYFVEVNPVVATITAGDGGTGVKAAGGAGGAVGSITLTGISHYDPDNSDVKAGADALVVTSGSGGDGATVGGNGGAITGVLAQNAEFSASGATAPADTVLNHTELTGAKITSGNGGNGGTGNGGTGGAITGLNIGVETNYTSSYLATMGTLTISGGGQLTVASGHGGAGGASGKGGAGGTITNDIIGSADAVYDYGLLLVAGDGGTATLGGGAGGSVTKIQLNAPANPQLGGGDGYDTLSAIILAGNGGGASGPSAKGGIGGSVSGIVESKDVNTAINLIQAGNGGSTLGSSGTGGQGGSISSINTVGLIGQPSDAYGNTFGVFQTNANPSFPSSASPLLASYVAGAGIPQGLFAGRGGTGTTPGLAGSVSNVNAAAIAAIGAAADPSTGLFAAAEKIAGITAETIGYSLEGDSTYQGSSPDQAQPTDGFIFSVLPATGLNVPAGGILAGCQFPPP